MSSTYRILCLSHDPALSFGDYDGPERAEAAIRSGVDEHHQCDLLIGRYSYPLIEVGCPPTAGPNRVEGPGRHRCVPHANTDWVDVAWLRILAAVHQSGDDRMHALASDTHLCHWSWERLRRLRDELGLTLEEET